MDAVLGRRGIAAVAAALLLAALVAIAPAPARANLYVGGGTVVYKEQGRAPDADKGTLACVRNTTIGAGGGCLPFDGNFVHVTDALAGDHVAYQVCIDNNGDGVCTSGGRKSPDPTACVDAVFFSHDDEGLFHNPMGPLPAGFQTGCGATAPWQGYVVFLCEGVHQTATPAGAPSAHSHTATTGTIAVETGGQPSGFGTFCGGNQEVVVTKPYTVIG